DTEPPCASPSAITSPAGPPSDAAAVPSNLTRHVEGRSRLAPLLTGITWTATDAQTVTFTIEQAWSGFPYVLAWTGGYIASPTAIQADPEGWSSSPVGAGPFVRSEFRPMEVLALAANPDDWGGRPNLAQVRFAPLQGDAAKAEALLSGDFQPSFVRLPVPARDVIEAGYPGFLTL